jgi:hypothetical protein
MNRRVARIGGVVMVCILLVIGLLWLWWAKWYQQPQRVFESMLENSLATPSVTRLVASGSGNTTLTQYNQLNFGVQPTAHDLTVYRGPAGTVTTEEISTPKADYVRFQQLSTEGISAAQAAQVVGPWAKLTGQETLGSTLSAQLFKTSLVSLVPLYNLTPAYRAQLLRFMHDNEIYTVDYTKVTTATLTGQRVFQFPVTVHPVAYAALMQKFGQLAGQPLLQDVDPASYSGSSDINAVISVDARSHQLAGIDIASSGQHERYTGFGVHSAVQVPHATVTAAQLQARLQSLKQP